MSRSISAGRLNRRIQIVRANVRDDGLGGRKTWGDLGRPIWAGRKDASDAERAAAGSLEAVTVARFLVRWSSFTTGITAKDRIREGGRVWSITGIKEVGWREYLELTAEARTDVTDMEELP